MVSAETTALDPNLTSEQAFLFPCYCEENVWRLAYRRLHYKRDDDAGETEMQREEIPEEYHVVFISNKRKCCPMFFQKAKEDSNISPCFWDYHVILIVTCRNIQDPMKTTTYVLDMDSRLPYPCPISTYLEKSFDFDYEANEEMRQFAPSFRVIPAAVYLENFYSDRMHMFDREKQTWSSPPPTYDCIMRGWDGRETKSRSNLDQYIIMETQAFGQGEGKFGYVLTLEEAKRKLCRPD